MKSFDALFIGSGISTAFTLGRFMERVRNGSTASFNIAVFDKANLRWTGVPYGPRADQSHFLIDTLANTECPAFSQWLLEHREFLQDWTARNAIASAWYLENEKDILDGKISHLFFPRFIFGLFVQNWMQSLMDALASRVNIHFIYDEVIDIQKNRIELDVLTKKGHYKGRSLVLAVGSIPKCPLVETSSPRYLSDSDCCAAFDLLRAFNDCLADSNNTPVSVCILGSAASAVETVFSLLHTEHSRRIDCIRVVSTSGRLCQGVNADDYCEEDVPQYVKDRTISNVYLNTLQAAHRQGKISVIKGAVRDVSLSDRAVLVHMQNAAIDPLRADFVVDCRGAGRLETTPSTLLSNLYARFPVNEEGRGFDVDNKNNLRGYKNIFINGPLLNRNYAGRQVESIRAVYQESQTIGDALFDSLIQPASGAETKQKDLLCP